MLLLPMHKDKIIEKFYDYLARDQYRMNYRGGLRSPEWNIRYKYNEYKHSYEIIEVFVRNFKFELHLMPTGCADLHLRSPRWEELGDIEINAAVSKLLGEMFAQKSKENAKTYFKRFASGEKLVSRL